MSHKGYAFESEIEDFFLSLTGQTKQDPILKADSRGLIKVNRSFRIPTSGAMESMKGDILTAIPWLPKQLKVECKARTDETKKEGRMIVIEKEWIIKNNEEARVDNQIPILTFSIKGVREGRIWWLLRQTDFDFIVHDTEYPYPLLFECKTGKLNKEQDKLKFVHDLLLHHGKVIEKAMWSLAIDDCAYVLLSHTMFEKAMQHVKVSKKA
jgi:hypothetical protein